MNDESHSKPPGDETPSDRVSQLAKMQVLSENPRLQIQAASALTQQMILEVPLTREETYWRKFITAAVNPLTTELWELYKEDCRIRGQLEKPYEVFLQLASTLTNPELPTYWRIYVDTCEGEIEPILPFLRRMQDTLNREKGIQPDGRYY